MLRFLERVCFSLGGGLIAAGAIAYVDSNIQRSSALEAFQALQSKVVGPEDQSDWSEARRKSYRDAIDREVGDTVAILRIDALDIEVPVFESTGEVALNRGVGHIAGSNLPGDNGNVAIAGHRDGFFRKLKDIEPGMSIHLLSLEGWQEFQVTDYSIVDPLDVGVLSSTREPTITLVTCFPFYFIGPAPDRFVVSAKLVDPSSTLAASSGLERLKAGE